MLCHLAIHQHFCRTIIILHILSITTPLPRAFWTVSNVGTDATYCIVMYLTWKNNLIGQNILLPLPQGEHYGDRASLVVPQYIEVLWYRLLSPHPTLVEVYPDHSLGQSGEDVGTITSFSPFICALFGETYTLKGHTQRLVPVVPTPGQWKITTCPLMHALHLTWATGTFSVTTPTSNILPSLILLL